jgi:hypothetical protein
MTNATSSAWRPMKGIGRRMGCRCCAMRDPPNAAAAVAMTVIPI